MKHVFGNVRFRGITYSNISYFILTNRFSLITSLSMHSHRFARQTVFPGLEFVHSDIWELLTQKVRKKTEIFVRTGYLTYMIPYRYMICNKKKTPSRTIYCTNDGTVMRTMVNAATFKHAQRRPAQTDSELVTVATIRPSSKVQRRISIINGGRNEKYLKTS